MENVDIKEIYDDFQDGDGMSAKELGDAIRMCGGYPTESDCQRLLNKYDADGNGKVSFDEFVNITNEYCNQAANDAALIEAFNYFDADGSGKLSAEEFRKILMDFGEPLNNEELHDFMSYADVDADGMLNKMEFLSLFRVCDAVNEDGEDTGNADGGNENEEEEAAAANSEEQEEKTKQEEEKVEENAEKEEDEKEDAGGDADARAAEERQKASTGQDETEDVGEEEEEADAPTDGDGFSRRKKSLGKNWDVVWKQPKDFCDTPVLFDGDISPQDIMQGELGDCYFMSALAVLAENPQRVLDLFSSQTYDVNSGMFTVRMCKNGMWEDVRVDDWFPCTPDGGPKFSRAKNGELWVAVLEKAYAKVHGSYAAIIGGDAAQALQDLTGCPVESHDNADKLKLFDLMLAADQKGYMMVAGVPEQPGDLQKELGLIEGHAYGVLRAAEADGECLVQVRNPWGDFEWKGDFSDSSPLWTDELKEQLGFTEEDDGTFWMVIDDFVKYFRGVDIVVCDPSWDFGSYETSFEGGCAQVLYMDVTEPTEIYINIMQKDRRLFHGKKAYNTYEYEAVHFDIFMEDPLTNVGSSDFCAGQCVGGKFSLEPGVYYVDTRCFNADSTREVVITTYASSMLSDCELKETRSFAEAVGTETLAAGAVAAEGSDGCTVTDCKDMQAPGIKLYQWSFGPYQVYHYVNKEEGKKLDDTVSFDLEGLRVVETGETGKVEIQVAVEANSSYTILLEPTGGYGGATSYSSSRSYCVV